VYSCIWEYFEGNMAAMIMLYFISQKLSDSGNTFKLPCIMKYTYSVLTFPLLARLFRTDEQYHFNTMVQTIRMPTYIRDLTALNLGVHTDHTHCGCTLFSSVRPVQCWDTDKTVRQGSNLCTCFPSIIHSLTYRTM
jgi:hypothetical protein